ncbi:hypothetical protein Scep_006302 [Stephania cephalantha]|uniref:Uncharacterized protein n=1 Tax=Stephania cephalantha TaxID=152367 RepID=A0AAP0K8Y4_9MAGN
MLQPHRLRGAEERLQQRLRPRPIPPQHRHNLTHLPITKPTKLLAKMPSPLVQNLLPRQSLQRLVSRVVELATLQRIQHAVRAVLLKPSRLEILM